MTSLVIGNDHRGVALKEKLASWILPPDNSRFDVSIINDVGAHNSHSVDYPDIVKKFAPKIDVNNNGILICGTGFGVCIAANRYKNIRAVVARSVKEVQLARQHNNVNVLCLGADFTSFWQAKRLIRAFYLTQFEAGRHQKRIKKL